MSVRRGSPLVTESLVIVPGGGPRRDGSAVSLVAYDRTTGERRWTGGAEQISYVTPQLVEFGGRPLVVSVNEAHIAAYDPAPDVVISSPIHALVAADDPLATAETVSPWARRTTAPFDLTVFAGDHFYINTNLPELSQWVEERIPGRQDRVC